MLSGWGMIKHHASELDSYQVEGCWGHWLQKEQMDAGQSQESKLPWHCSWGSFWFGLACLCFYNWTLWMEVREGRWARIGEREPAPDVDWCVKVMIIIIVVTNMSRISWVYPKGKTLWRFHILLIFHQLHDTETQVSFTVKPKAFLGAASCLNLHCTVPDMGNLHQGWLSCPNEEYFYLCRANCLKYWVGQKVHSDFFCNVMGNKDSVVSRQVLCIVCNSNVCAS